MINFLRRTLEGHLGHEYREDGKVAYVTQRQAYVFIKNNALVSLENSSFLIFMR